MLEKGVEKTEFESWLSNNKCVKDLRTFLKHQLDSSSEGPQIRRLVSKLYTGIDQD